MSGIRSSRSLSAALIVSLLFSLCAPPLSATFTEPLLKYLRELARKNPERHIAVLVLELVKRRWYHFLFRHRATLLKAMLILRGGPQIVISTAPWYVQRVLKASNSPLNKSRALSKCAWSPETHPFLRSQAPAPNRFALHPQMAPGSLSEPHR